LTLQANILAPLKDEKRHCPQKTSLYVGLSRVRDPSQMRFLERLTMEYCNYFKPPQELIEETRRLESLEI
jgi:hypothetical protein